MGGRTMSGIQATRETCDSIINDLIKSGFDKVCEEWEVCGSYRRGKKIMSDLDIVFIPRTSEDFLSWFDKIDFEKKVTRVGNYYLKIRNVQVDLFIATKENYGIQKLNFTGPAGFSIFLMGWLRQTGISDNEAYDLYSF